MKREIAHIRELLERYYNAVSTPEEEDELIYFFLNADDVPEDMIPDQRMFKAIGESFNEVTPPAGFADKIMGDTYMPGISKRMGFRKFILLAGVAASILCIIVISLQFINHDENMDNDNTIGIALTSSDYMSEPETVSSSEIMASNSESERNRIPEVTAEIDTKPKATEKTMIKGKDVDRQDEYLILAESEQETILQGLDALSRAGNMIASAQERIVETNKTLETTYRHVCEALK